MIGQVRDGGVWGVEGGLTELADAHYAVRKRWKESRATPTFLC